MFQNEILVEVLLVHFVHFGCVHKVDDLTDAVDRCSVEDPNAISDPSAYSCSRLSVDYQIGSAGMRTLAIISEPRCCIMLDQRSTGDLTLGQVVASQRSISCCGLAVELSVAFFLLFELAYLTVFFLF